MHFSTNACVFTWHISCSAKSLLARCKVPMHPNILSAISLLPPLSQTKGLQMLRTLITTAILATCLVHSSSAQDGVNMKHHAYDAGVTTLRLYFPPSIVVAQQNQTGFTPEVAKLYVDDLYVGDAIVNLHGYIPALRFSKSTHKLKVEMSANRKFETQITFLGNGSTQVLYVDFPKSTPKTNARGE